MVLNPRLWETGTSWHDKNWLCCCFVNRTMLLSSRCVKELQAWAELVLARLFYVLVKFLRVSKPVKELKVEKVIRGEKKTQFKEPTFQNFSLACVQTSPFVATKEIGDVCTQAQARVINNWNIIFNRQCNLLTSCRIISSFLFALFVFLGIFFSSKTLMSPSIWQIFQPLNDSLQMVYELIVCE